MHASLVLALFATLSGCALHSRLAREHSRIATELEELAKAPLKLVLYSLDPDPANWHDQSIRNDRVFYGFEILGHARIIDSAEQQALLHALAQGVRENYSSFAACFDPRHALHIEAGGRSIDLTICFECLQVEAHGLNKNITFFTSASPQRTFDDPLMRHHLRLAPK